MVQDRSTAMRRSAVLPILLAWALLLLPAAGASAHAILLAADPPDGAVLPAMPAALTLRFNEPVALLAAAIALPDGTTQPLAAASGLAPALTLALPPGSARGTRGVTVRVASGDGHPVVTTLLFSVGAPSPDVVPPDPANDAVRGAVWLARLVSHVALFFAVGGLVARCVLGAGGSPGLGMPLVGLASLGAVVGLHGVDAIGGGFALLATPHPWRVALETSVPRFAACAAVALVIVLAARRLTGVGRRVAAGVAVAAAGAALAVSGHAASADPVVITRTALVLHGAALALWLGALPPLLRSARPGEPALARLLRRFSVLAPVAVAVLVLGGASLAVIQLTAPSDLWRTGYGRVLLAKLVLVVAILAFAAWNRWWLTRPALAGDPAAVATLRRSVGAEIVLAVAVLAVVGIFRFTPPPRVLAAAAAEPAYVHIHTEPAMADVTIAPGRVGPVGVTAVLLTGDFGPLPARDVTVSFTDPAGRAPAATAKAVLGPEGYRAERLDLPEPGRWTLTIAGTADGVPFTLSAPVDIRP